jgi:hypothetical protein
VKPRYYLWSLANFLCDRRSQTLAELVEWRPAYGVLKLFLELTLPLGDAGRCVKDVPHHAGHYP